MVSANVALKVAVSFLKKKIAEKPDGGVKTQIDGEEKRIKFTDILDELERLHKAAEEDRLKVVTLCRGCSAFTGGSRAPYGSCFKKEFTSSRLAKDYCSLYEKDGKQQRRGLY